MMSLSEALQWIAAHLNPFVVIGIFAAYFLVVGRLLYLTHLRAPTAEAFHEEESAARGSRWWRWLGLRSGAGLSAWLGFSWLGFLWRRDPRLDARADAEDGEEHGTGPLGKADPSQMAAAGMVAAPGIEAAPLTTTTRHANSPSRPLPKPDRG